MKSNIEGGTQPVFENERYFVIVTEFPGTVLAHGADYFHGYAVINKQTEVEEVYVTTLPDAIASAEQLDLALENEPWAWVRVESDAAKLDRPKRTEAGPEEVH